MREADRELMKKRQEDIKQIVVEPFDKKARELTVSTIAKAKAFDILMRFDGFRIGNRFYEDSAHQCLLFDEKDVFCYQDITEEEYDLLKELGVEEE